MNAHDQLDVILQSAEADEANQLEKQASQSHEPEMIEDESQVATHYTGGLVDLTKQAQEQNPASDPLVDKAMALYAQSEELEKTASENSGDTLLKIAEDTLSDIQDLEKQAQYLGQVAAAEFMKNIN